MPRRTKTTKTKKPTTTKRKPGAPRKPRKPEPLARASVPRHMLTHAVSATICDALKRGITEVGASAHVGVTKQCFYGWLRRGRAAIAAAESVAGELEHEPEHDELLKLIDPSELPFVEFVMDVEQAYADAESHFTEKLHAAADWKAGAWWLERRRRRDYGQESTLHVQQLEPASMTNDELIAELSELGFVQAAVIQAPLSAATHGNGEHAPEPAVDVRALTDGGGGSDGARTEQG